MRDVTPVRLSVGERRQIAAAAARLKLPFSSFLRQAALQASAVVERKVAVKAEHENGFHAPEQPRDLVVVEPRSDHHFVDGICMRCWRDVDERDLPCTTA
jgi:hypothetical protein